jgi:hypothetical protein
MLWAIWESRPLRSQSLTLRRLSRATIAVSVDRHPSRLGDQRPHERIRQAAPILQHAPLVCGGDREDLKSHCEDHLALLELERLGHVGQAGDQPFTLFRDEQCVAVYAARISQRPCAHVLLNLVLIPRSRRACERPDGLAVTLLEGAPPLRHASRDTKRRHRDCRRTVERSAEPIAIARRKLHADEPTFRQVVVVGRRTVDGQRVERDGRHYPAVAPAGQDFLEDSHRLTNHGEPLALELVSAY